MAISPEQEALPNAESKRNDLNPKLVLIDIPTEDLKPPKNPVKKQNRKQLLKISKSIEAFGWVVPLLVAGDNEIIDGETRYHAAKALDLKTIPCIRTDHLSGQEVRLLRISLNKIGETGEWDPLALRLELTYQLEFGADLSITGFEAPEIDNVLEFGGDNPDEFDPLDDISNIHMPQKGAVSQQGDLWLLGKNRVLCGNARNPEHLSRLVSDNPITLILADPPFNLKINGHVRTSDGKYPEFAEASGEMTKEEFANFLTEAFGSALAFVAEGGLIYCFMDWRHLDEVRDAIRRLALEQINLAVWVKPYGGMGSLYRSRHELIFVAKRKGEAHRNNVELGKHGRYRTNVWEFGGASGGTKSEEDDFSVHPTVKPVKLLQEIMLDVTAAGEFVLDPFLGSGSTLLAAERVLRACLGLEISPAYVDVTIARWEQMTGEEAIHADSGLTFRQVQKQREIESGCIFGPPEPDSTSPASFDDPEDF
ncbi:MAG: site-specific DNA-methyltransferase [Paracoccaceae bacterium]|nr:site-specific DNA-methyltransferase [Paracoccaceae bacterium]